jgi:hypothetical protein
MGSVSAHDVTVKFTNRDAWTYSGYIQLFNKHFNPDMSINSNPGLIGTYCQDEWWAGHDATYTVNFDDNVKKIFIHNSGVANGLCVLINLTVIDFDRIDVDTDYDADETIKMTVRINNCMYSHQSKGYWNHPFVPANFTYPIDIKSDSVLSLNTNDVVSVGDKLNGVVKLVNNSSNLGIAGADLNVTVKKGSELIHSKILSTNDNGILDLSDLDYNFTKDGTYNLSITYNGDDKYSSSNVEKNIMAHKWVSSLSLNTNDVVSVGDKLNGVVKLVNNSSNLGIAGADLNVMINDGSTTFNGALSTDSLGVIDLDKLGYTFTKDGKCNLSVTYNGDNYYESSSVSKNLVVYPLPVPFNGTFHLDNPDGYYNIHLNNSRGSVLDDSVVLYNMSEALNGYVIKGNLSTRNAEANIVNNILTIKWNVPAGKFGYVTMFVKKG